MRTLYGTDSRGRLWTKTEYADGRIEIQMQKKFGDRPVKITPHSHHLGVVCFQTGNSFHHQPLEYINWTTEKHTKPITATTGYLGGEVAYNSPLTGPQLEWLTREIATWGDDDGSTE